MTNLSRVHLNKSDLQKSGLKTSGLFCVCLIKLNLFKPRIISPSTFEYGSIFVFKKMDLARKKTKRIIEAGTESCSWEVGKIFEIYLWMSSFFSNTKNELLHWNFSRISPKVTFFCIFIIQENLFSRSTSQWLLL